jgi:hypothetical protein
MAELRIRIRIHKAISRRPHLLYDGIVAQGVPDRFAAILIAPDGDKIADSAAA